MIQFQKQVMMRKVLYALTPVLLFSIFLYGWRVITVSILVFSVGIATEYFMEKAKKKTNTKVSEAVLVTCLIYTLSIPSGLAGDLAYYWIIAVGIFFGVMFGKAVYGGFGKNIFNPALTGRLFIYSSFPIAMGTGFLSGNMFGTDVITSATPLEYLAGNATLKSLNLGFPELPLWLNLFLGFRAGSLGEGSILLILLGGIYLVYTKTADHRPMLGTMLGALITLFIYSMLGKNIDILAHMFSGGLIFLAVFMATDPVSAPKSSKALWVYGLMVGFISISMRLYSSFPEGVSYALLTMNMFAALLDKLLAPKKNSKAIQDKE